MTGSAVVYPVYSRLTFALFRDMGWYAVRPNQTTVQTLHWGKGMYDHHSFPLHSRTATPPPHQGVLFPRGQLLFLALDLGARGLSS